MSVPIIKLRREKSFVRIFFGRVVASENALFARAPALARFLILLYIIYSLVKIVREYSLRSK